MRCFSTSAMKSRACTAPARFREVFIRRNEIFRLAVNVGEITASPPEMRIFFPIRSYARGTATRAAFAGLVAQRSPAARRQEPRREFAHQERVSLDSEAALCRVSSHDSQVKLYRRRPRKLPPNHQRPRIGEEVRRPAFPEHFVYRLGRIASA